jgi:hypothetical protein
MHGHLVVSLKGHFPWARVPGHYLASGPQPDPGAPRSAHDEKTVQHVLGSGQPAEEGEAGRPVTAQQKVCRPAGIGERGLEPLTPEGPIAYFTPRAMLLTVRTVTPSADPPSLVIRRLWT